MTSRASTEPAPSRTIRASRAEALMIDRPHAAPLLRFYQQLLDAQAPVADLASQVVNVSGGLAASIAGIPSEAMGDLFVAFLDRLESFGPERLAVAARDLGGTVTERIPALIAERVAAPDAATSETPDDDARDVLLLAFAQPLAESLATRAAPARDSIAGGCPACGHRPVVAVLDDEPDAKGRRSLVCGLCGAMWSFVRSRCPSCGEDRADRLSYHEAESLDHMRVEACRSCGGYLKAVDRRRDGKAVPVVDDIATVELDLWAADHDLRKVAPNIVGF